MTMEPSGPSFTVVVPGSADDPFSAGNAGQMQDPDKTPVNATGPVSQPGIQPPVPAPAAEPAGGAPANTPLTQEQVDAIVVQRLTAAQSGWDKRNRLLEDQLKSEREARESEATQHRDELRRAQLDGLPPSERARLQESWNLEDARAEVSKQAKAVQDYHKVVEGLRLFQTYAQFGVTEDDLLGIADVDAMEAFCKDKKLSFLEGKLSGGSSQNGNGPSSKPAAAGSTAPYDPGGNPPAPGENKLLTSEGVEAMGANIKSLFGSGGNVPW